MKKAITLLLGLVLCLNVFAQETRYKVDTILAQQNFFVDWCGPINCNNRVVYKITLPPHTAQWCYGITGYNNQEDSQKALGFINDLASLTRNPGAAIAAGLTTAMISLSPAVFTVRVIDENNKALFLAKQNYSYYSDVSRKDFQGGWVSVTNIKSGSYYIAIENTANFKGLYFSLMAFAVVRDNSVWCTESKGEVFDVFKDKYYKASFMDTDYANYVAEYISDKIYEKYTPETWENAVASQKNNDVAKYYDECIQSLVGEVSENAPRSNTYAKLATKSLDSKDVAKAVEYAEKAVEYDKTNVNAIQTLGLAYIADGKEAEGLECYVDAIELIKKYRFRYLVNQRMKDLKSNLKTYQKKYPNVDFSGIIDLVKSEKMSFWD